MKEGHNWEMTVKGFANKWNLHSVTTDELFDLARTLRSQSLEEGREQVFREIEVAPWSHNGDILHEDLLEALSKLRKV